ncbi:MAG: CocE/NonD family hydrolase [Candidatus Thermoplasmatota archaeon]|nr:CocE/NonD family hydrolase [Candidatus Thermoplasmatota archaeon]
MRSISMLLIFLLPSILSGCFGEDLQNIADESSAEIYPEPWDRSDLEYDNSDVFSRVTVNGSYDIGPVQSVFVPVPSITFADGGAGAAGGAEVHLGLWLPVIEGCDYSSTENLSSECQVPVIAEIGPYYSDGDVDATTPANRLGRMLIENYVPHGYGVAQVSVFGTGESNHCMDLMGTDEQRGIDAAVTWLGTQSWSNGKVGIIGKSYDGSTPWQAATFGNPYLATIVPMSGLIGVHELMWRNGSMEARGMIMHNGVYGSFGIDGDEEDYQNICPDYLIGPGTGTSAYLLGSEVFGDYWAERYFLDRVLENYQGSVYLIQGMHDWNVDPHMAVPTMNALIDAGIEAKGLFGQWDHDYPDRPEQLFERSDLGGRGGEAFPQMIRYDWMQDLLEWFEYYLQERGPQPGQWIEVQDNYGEWRIESRYPPSDATEWVASLGGELSNVGGSLTILPDASSGPAWETEPLTETLRVVGTPRLHVDVTTASVGGQIYALLEDCFEGSCIHVGHAIMDLRYHAGGDDIQTWIPVLETINAKMEFMPLDAMIEEGHTIRVSLASTGEDYLPASTSSIVTIQEGEGSTLQLDIIDKNSDERMYFIPPICEHELCS